MVKIKLSTRSRYGLKAIVDIASQSQNNLPVSIKEIASRQNIPENYLEQIITMLKKSNLIKSIRGVHGGYILNCDPDIITVADILKILEDNLYFIDCLKNNFDQDKDQDQNNNQNKNHDQAQNNNNKYNKNNFCGFKKNKCVCESCFTKNIWLKIYKNIISAVDSITLNDLVKDYKNILLELELLEANKKA